MKKIGYKKFGLIPSEYFSSSDQKRRSLNIALKSIIYVAIAAAAVYTIVTWPFLPIQVQFALSEIGIQIGGARRVDLATIDSDNDGLSDIAEINFFGTNPNNRDSDEDGISDGEEIITGSNPFNTDPDLVDSDGDGLTDKAERETYGTDPFATDTDGDGFPDTLELVHGYSPVLHAEGAKAQTLEQRSRNIREELADARIIIPKIGVNAPILWLETTDEDAIHEAMPNGIVHYARSAFPGNPGNTVLVGHSSNYWWEHGEYNQAFSLLGDLEKGDEIIIQNENFRFVYKVDVATIRNADETDYFAQTGEPTLTLQTSWPIGTAAKRLVVSSKQVRPLASE